jgi:DnaK suppressor protein
MAAGSLRSGLSGRRRDVRLNALVGMDMHRTAPDPDEPAICLARPVNMEDVNGARDRLEADRGETLERLANLTDDYDAVLAASRDTNADDEHDPEGATIAFERSQIAALVRQAQLHLVEIDAALHRLNAETYGTCERCAGAIGEDRLVARPVARTCIHCATTR